MRSSGRPSDYGADGGPSEARLPARRAMPSLYVAIVKGMADGPRTVDIRGVGHKHSLVTTYRREAGMSNVYPTLLD